MKTINKHYRCIVAEGPLWDDRNNTLLFLDILGKCIFKMDYSTKKMQKIDIGQQIGCMALCENDDLLLAMQDGIYRMNAQGEKVLAHQSIQIKGRRFIDGKVGPDGCFFYVGTTDDNGLGAFYRLKDGVLNELFDHCGCSNGLDWTVDESNLFYCDTRLQKIEIFDFDASTIIVLVSKHFGWDIVQVVSIALAILGVVSLCISIFKNDVKNLRSVYRDNK